MRKFILTLSCGVVAALCANAKLVDTVYDFNNTAGTNNKLDATVLNSQGFTPWNKLAQSVYRGAWLENAGVDGSGAIKLGYNAGNNPGLWDVGGLIKEVKPGPITFKVMTYVTPSNNTNPYEHFNSNAAPFFVYEMKKEANGSFSLGREIYAAANLEQASRQSWGSSISRTDFGTISLDVNEPTYILIAGNYIVIDDFQNIYNENIVRGRVVSSEDDGAPGVEGAIVNLLSTPVMPLIEMDASGAPDEAMDAVLTPQYPIVTSTVTDADGNYEFIIYGELNYDDEFKISANADYFHQNIDAFKFDAYNDVTNDIELLLQRNTYTAIMQNLQGERISGGPIFVANLDKPGSDVIYMDENPDSPGEYTFIPAVRDSEGFRFRSYTAAPGYDFDTDDFDFNESDNVTRVFTLYKGLNTGIDEIGADAGNDDKIYSIDGKQLNQVPTEGIYIKNGKKILITK